MRVFDIVGRQVAKLAANKVEATISNLRKRAREETITIPQIYDEALQVIKIINVNRLPLKLLLFTHTT